MWIYEVNLEVDSLIAKEFEKWLPLHIQQVIQAGGFQKAIWMEQDDSDANDKSRWSIAYYTSSKIDLDSYLKNRSPGLRQEAIKKFGNQFTAHRRILKLKSIV